MKVLSNLDFGNVRLVVALDPTEIRQGVIRIATAVEVSAGVDDSTAITPLKLKGALLAQTARTFAATIGDGAALTYVVNHNLNTKRCLVDVVEVASGATVGVDVARTTVNSVTITFVGTPPAVNAFEVLVVGFT